VSRALTGLLAGVALGVQVVLPWDEVLQLEFLLALRVLLDQAGGLQEDTCVRLLFLHQSGELFKVNDPIFIQVQVAEDFIEFLFRELDLQVFNDKFEVSEAKGSSLFKVKVPESLVQVGKPLINLIPKVGKQLPKFYLDVIS